MRFGVRPAPYSKSEHTMKIDGPQQKDRVGRLLRDVKLGATFVASSDADNVWHVFIRTGNGAMKLTGSGDRIENMDCLSTKGAWGGTRVFPVRILDSRWEYEDE